MFRSQPQKITQKFSPNLDWVLGATASMIMWPAVFTTKVWVSFFTPCMAHWHVSHIGWIILATTHAYAKFNVYSRTTSSSWCCSAGADAATVCRGFDQPEAEVMRDFKSERSSMLPVLWPIWYIQFPMFPMEENLFITFSSRYYWVVVQMLDAGSTPMLLNEWFAQPKNDYQWFLIPQKVPFLYWWEWNRVDIVCLLFLFDRTISIYLSSYIFYCFIC